MKHYFKYVILTILLSFLAGNFVSAGEIGLYAKLYNLGKVSTAVQPQLKVVVDDISNFNLEVKPEFQEQTIKTFDNKFHLILNQNSLLSTAVINVKQVKELMDLPWKLKKLSQIYQFDFTPEEAFDRYLIVQISYEDLSNDYKQIFSYNSQKKSWLPLVSTDYPEKQYIQAVVETSSARLAVFEHSNVMTVGQASWYAYQGGDFAASPDFPKGSIIRVINTDNDRLLDVTINDWGPERDKFPNRVIDLDKLAFAKLASLGAGIINVKLQPLYIAPDPIGRVLGVKKIGMSKAPIITAKSAVIMNNDTGEVLFNKNGDEVLPLASLTKLVAIYTYLQTKPSLFATIKYRDADEKITYKYVKPWESARIILNDGDKVLAKDMVYSALVRSANNAVETLVRSSGLSRAEFLKRMNNNVKAWGAVNTYFEEPTGLSLNNVSTAQEYAIIIREVFKNKTIAQASTTPRYKFTTIGTDEDHIMSNTDKLVASHPEIVGSKTGYLREAGFSLVAKIKKNNKEFLITSFGTKNRTISLNEMTSLITYAINNL